MKKTAISKILIVFVLMALIFSLCACSGGNNGNSSSGGKTKGNTKLSAPVFTSDAPDATGKIEWKIVTGATAYEYIVTEKGETVDEGTINVEKNVNNRNVTIKEGQTLKVRAVSSDSSIQASDWSEMTSKLTATKQVLGLLDGAKGLIDTWNDTKATDTLSVDLALGGYFKSGDNKANNAALSVKANANKNNPEALIELVLNEEPYISIGYKSDKVVLRHPLTKFNGEDIDNTFAIDVTALNPAVKSLMTAVMEWVANDATDLDFDAIYNMAAGFLGNPTLATAIDGVLEGGLVQTDTQTTLGVTLGLLGTALPIVTGFLPEGIDAKVDNIIGYINKGMDVLKMGELKLNGHAVTYDYLTSAEDGLFADISADNEEASLLNIVFATTSAGVLNKINLVLDLGAFGFAGMDYEMGLTIDLPVFSTSSTANISISGFTAQDIEIDLNGALPIKGLDVDAVAAIRLSNGLAAKGNKWADVTVKTTGNKVSTAYINDDGAYVDFTGVFQTLGVADVQAKFKAEYKNSDDTALNLVDKINASAAEVTIPVPQKKTEAANAAEQVDTSIDVFGLIDEFKAAENKIDFITGKAGEIGDKYNAATDKIDFFCDIAIDVIKKIDEDAVFEGKGQAAIIKYFFELEFGDTETSAKDYVLFYEYEDGDETKEATTFKQLLDNIKACHDAGVDALKASLNNDTKTAGIQIYKENPEPENEEDEVEGDDLLDYIACFVIIPTIDNEGNPDFANRGAINDADNLIAWLDWVFPIDNEYRLMVEDILGCGLSDVVNNGLYLEAKALIGLAGEVKAATDKDAGDDATYIKLGGGIHFVSGNKKPAAVSNISGAINFTDKNAETTKYYIEESAKAMLDGLRAYVPAEEE